MSSFSLDASPFRVAIIGGGPRALWAVEELLVEAREAGFGADGLGASGFSVDVFDPYSPGAGQVYRAEQPGDWLLNVRSDAIRTGMGTFDQWRVDQGEDVRALDPFPPRRLAGEFLAESWQRLVADVPNVRHMPVRVTDLERVGEQWRVASSVNVREAGDVLHDDALHGDVIHGDALYDGAPHGDALYDQVLISTGHATEWPGALHNRSDIPDSLPVTSPYRCVDWAAGGACENARRLGVRGAALTFLDLIMSLAARDDVDEFTVYPVNRGGRLMTVKPQPGSALDAIAVPAQRAEPVNQKIESAAGLDELIAGVADGAAAFLEAAGITAGEAQREAIMAVLEGRDFEGDAFAELKHSLAVAKEQETPDARWAVGQAWRAFYPAVVRRASYAGRDSLPGFAAFAKRLEPIGFGPPIATAETLIDLVERGVVKLDYLGKPGQVDAWIDAYANDANDEHAGEKPGIDALVDAVIPPPGIVDGTLIGELVGRGVLKKREGKYGESRGVDVGPDAMAAGWRDLAVVGRATEDTLLGPDTLSRTLHDVIKKWSKTVMTRVNSETPALLPAEQIHADPPLTARLEPWAEELLAAPETADRLLVEYGSPVNVLNPALLDRNARELVDAGAQRGVDVRVFYARKANKALGFVDAAKAAGHGVDVASRRELEQVLARGVAAEKIILSAAIKPDDLLHTAVEAGVVVSVDSVLELQRIEQIAAGLGVTAKVAPRLAPNPELLPPTRFGELLDVWRDYFTTAQPKVAAVGVHAHLHGYSEAGRRIALGEVLGLTDALVAAGYEPEFVDMGGGVPMSYIDDGDQWAEFQRRLAAQNQDGSDPFTWKNDPLTNIYPFHQSPVRGGWLGQLLDGEVTVAGAGKANAGAATTDAGATTAAAALKERDLRLHLEPGRSVLDGCGMILARVEFVKKRSDGLPLVGVEMNRTQCRTASDDLLVDPLLYRLDCAGTERAGAEAGDVGATDGSADETWSDQAFSGFLVGAYCIEDEVIIRRRMNFPNGVRPGEIIAIPGTAGYYMHILESASHQIPLAKNVVLNSTRKTDSLTGRAGTSGLSFSLDEIDRA